LAVEKAARAYSLKSASALSSDWSACHCELQLFRLRPDMAHLGMSMTVAPETLSPLMIGCLFVILYVCVFYDSGYDGVK